MQLHEREYYLYKILSGLHQVKVEGRFFIIKSNTILDKYEASKIYLNVVQNEEGYKESDIEEFLISRGHWSLTMSSRLKYLEKEIENTLVVLYEGRNNQSIQVRNRAKLQELRDERNELFRKRHAYDYITLEYLANLAKTKFLLGCSLYENDNKYWKDYDDWQKSDNLLDRIVVELNKEFIPYEYYRELARTEPWRTMWVARKSGSPIFNQSTTELNESQQTLISWTVRYDNLYQHPNCPSNTVIEDDDLLDGWYIVETRKEKEEKQEGVLGKIHSKEIAQSSEVFIKADNVDEIDETYSLNNGMNRSIIRYRQKELAIKGEINEADFTDVKQQRQMEINKGLINARRN